MMYHSCEIYFFIIDVDYNVICVKYQFSSKLNILNSMFSSQLKANFNFKVINNTYFIKHKEFSLLTYI